MFKPVLTALAAVATLAVTPVSAAALTPGDLFVYRVGDGSGSLVSSGNVVFVDEYTTAGTFVQSIAMPTVVSGANGRLIASGTATSDGLLTFSADQKYLMLTGYDAAVGGPTLTGTTSAAVARTVGRVDLTGAIDTTTRLSDAASTGNFRGVASSNGTDLWVTGSVGGVRYATLGATTSTQLSTTVNNLRAVEIFDGQLYTSDSSGPTVRLGAVGSGLPTTAGQVITNLPGFATTGSPYAFYFADLDAGVAGLDTLYVADDTAGLTKYSLVAGSWTSNGTIGAAADTFRGLTGNVLGGSVSLFAVGSGGSAATGGGKLVALTDTSGYNGAFSATPITIATALTNTAFRGVAYLPAAVPEAGTWAMLAAGLVAVGAVARRRRA